jgi:glycerol-3-phosphate dehydrogenase
MSHSANYDFLGSDRFSLIFDIQVQKINKLGSDGRTAFGSRISKFSWGYIAVVTLVKGSHFIVKRLYPGQQAYLLQNDDDRVVFVIPFGTDFTLVGTTDTEYSGAPAAVEMDGDEEAYLLQVLNACFTRQVGREDILWCYAGVRPLCDDDSTKPSDISRDYILELGLGDDGSAPLLSIFGGKITTYRKLAETALAQLKLNPSYHRWGPTGRLRLIGLRHLSAR